MNRITILADIAGRTMLSTAGSPKTVAGAVAIDTASLAEARSEVRGLPKWGQCRSEHAEHVVDYLASQAVAVSVVSVNRSTPQWLRFEQEAKVLQGAIVKQSKQVAGWVKAPNFLKFLLLGSACAVATGYALRVDPRSRIVGATGRQLIECSAICDKEVEGTENLEVFTSMWSEQRIHRSGLERLGIDMIARDIRVTSDDEEPALFLADYVAGLGLAASLDNPGRLALPLDQARANQLLGKLRARTKLATLEEDFAHTHDDIYGDVMAAAARNADN